MHIGRESVILRSDEFRKANFEKYLDLVHRRKRHVVTNSSRSIFVAVLDFFLSRVTNSLEGISEKQFLLFTNVAWYFGGGTINFLVFKFHNKLPLMCKLEAQSTRRECVNLWVIPSHVNIFAISRRNQFLFTPSGTQTRARHCIQWRSRLFVMGFHRIVSLRDLSMTLWATLPENSKNENTKRRLDHFLLLRYISHLLTCVVLRNVWPCKSSANRQTWRKNVCEKRRFCVLYDANLETLGPNHQEDKLHFYVPLVTSHTQEFVIGVGVYLIRYTFFSLWQVEPRCQW